MSGEERITFTQRIGFEWRYRANLQVKMPGQGKYDDTFDQTIEVQGAGYKTYNDALIAAIEAQRDVIAKLRHGVYLLTGKRQEPEEEA